jgi:hypothetical protein
MKSVRKRLRPRWIVLSAAASAALLAALPLSNANAATMMTMRVGYPNFANCIVYTLQRANGTVEKDRQSIAVEPAQETLVINELVDPGDKMHFQGAVDSNCDSSFDKALGQVDFTVPDPVPGLADVTIPPN